MSDGGIGEAVKGIVGGTASTIKSELKEAGKVAVQQTIKPMGSPTQQTPGQLTQDSYKVADEQKKAQIRNRLHNELMRGTPSNPNKQSQGPIAEQSFSSNQPKQTHMSQLGTSQPQAPNIVVENAINPGEQGRSKKG